MIYTNFKNKINQNIKADLCNLMVFAWLYICKT